MFWLAVALALGRLAARGGPFTVFLSGMCLAAALMALGAFVQKASTVAQTVFWVTAILIATLPAVLMTGALILSWIHGW
jgi:hypothetical protein